MRTLVCLLTIAMARYPVPSFAQETLAGAWNVTWEIGRTRADGGATAVMATGVLAVRADGDSLAATVVISRHSDGGTPVVPRFAMSGRRTATGGELLQYPQTTLSNGSDDRQPQAVFTWQLAVRGDRLSGVIRRELASAGIELPPVQVTGTRVP